MAETTKLLRCGRTITLSGGLKMKHFRELLRAEAVQDLEAMYPFFARLVKAWDFPGLDPQQPESYDELEITEFRQVSEAIGEHLRGEMEAKN